MLDNKHLRSFLRVLDLGGFSRASRSLHIAQPAISQHVRKLEDQLGVSLLDRSAHGVSPTLAGREFAGHARAILELVASAERRFKVDPKALYGEITLGIPGSVCPVVAADVITETRRRHPDIRLTVSELMSGNLADLLREGRMDLAILFNVSETDDYTSEPLTLEKLHLVGAPGDPLLEGPTIPAERLAGLPLVGTRPPHGLRLQIERWMNETGVELTFEIEADAPSVLVNMAAQGDYYSILSPSAVRREIAAGYLASAEVADPAIERTACLCCSKRLPPDPARDAVHIVVRDVLTTVAREGEWWGPATTRGSAPA